MSQEPVERGASEAASDSPMTETEAEASRRPPSTGEASDLPLADDEPRDEDDAES
ncbi:hypothetical protein O7635_34050 [Asanoa sp. WMMD1127]|uniref:hypothetical protein n=1 Tax=Asanoa sp. WMMD1127 TaxID=3016107 RepID=UPI0024166937|nr:hypothetical protein [Asanoa sp. WMMD1127]MDG4826897.1 hypothetical protein [Asanoa sp. WMMD1127]